MSSAFVDVATPFIWKAYTAGFLTLFLIKAFTSHEKVVCALVFLCLQFVGGRGGAGSAVTPFIVYLSLSMHISTAAAAFG